MKRIRALLVEDNQDDVDLMLHELEQAGVECQWKRVDGPEAFREAIEQETWDVILADFTMPRFTAPAALEILKQSGRDVPFLIVSGSVSEAIAVEAMKAGAHDFFAKTNLPRLGPAIAREMREARGRRERHQAVAQLRRAEEKYRLIVDNVRDYAIFMLDAAGDVASWNQGAERLLGYREAEVLGKPFATFFAEEDRGAGGAEEALRKASDEGSHVGEGRRIRHDRTHFWALSTLDRILMDGELAGYSAVLRDVTEKKQLLDELRQAVRARDDFLSIASHELKTPLTSMTLQLQSLQKVTKAEPQILLSDEKVGKKLAIIERQAERLAGLINSLLDVTRIASGRLDLRLETVDLSAVVKAVVAAVRDSLVKAGSSLTVQSRPGVVGKWDRLRLETTVANLLSNAIKYGAGKPIEVSVEQEGSWARLRVRDQGIGIAPEEQGRIFQRFARAVLEEHYGGLGLGLWIVGQIVEAHGGAVRVDSRLGAGATFIVELPVRPEGAGDETPAKAT